jgi:hypothetical protein
MNKSSVASRPVVKAAPLGGLEQLPELLNRDDRHRRFRDARRLHPLHWRVVDLAFLEGPAPELLKGSELDGKRRRLHLVAAQGEVRLDMLAPDATGHRGHPGRVDMADQRVEGREVDPGLVGPCGVEVERERVA